MADDPFYQKPEEQPAESQTVKVGEKEYTQDELSKLVGLGETAQEYESKWNRGIAEFYPDYTKKSQRLAELERAEEERQKAQETQKQQELTERSKQGQLTPEEMTQVARQEAKKLGLVLNDDIESLVQQGVSKALEGQRVLDETNKTVAEVKKNYDITTSALDILKYMDEEGIKSPSVAVKMMYEEQIDKVKAQKLQSIKPQGMTTQEQSTAGASSAPQKTTITRENLADAIRASLTRGGRG